MERFFSLLFENLKISEDQQRIILKKTFEQFQNETTTSITLNKTCQYMGQFGKNKGVLCGKIAKNEFEEQFYCSTHLKTISNRKKKKETNTIKNVKKDIKLNKIELPPKYEIEKRGDHFVIKGTLYIIDPDRQNSCTGKFIGNELDNKINNEDIQTLEQLGVEYYQCKFEEDEEIEKELETVDIIED